MTRFDSTQIAPATPTVRRAFGYSIFMLLFILLSYCQDAHAAPLPRTAAWDPPTTRENGEPLTVDELDHYTLYELVDGAQVVELAQVIDPNGDVGHER